MCVFLRAIRVKEQKNLQFNLNAAGTVAGWAKHTRWLDGEKKFEEIEATKQIYRPFTTVQRAALKFRLR